MKSTSGFARPLWNVKFIRKPWAEGMMPSGLEEMNREPGLQGGVNLTGEVADVRRYVNSMDVAVLCSHSGGFPNAILEYMAVARPIVATAVGGNNELSMPQVNGLPVSPGKVMEQASTIETLQLDRNPAARSGNDAHRHARTHFSRELKIGKYHEMSERISPCGIARRNHHSPL